MATELTVVEAPAAYERDILNTPVAPGFVASDNTTGNTVRCTGRELVLVYNTDVSPHTVTVTSQPASRTGRLGHITTAAVAAGATKAFQIFPRDGWEVGGLVTLQTDDALVKIAVIRLPVQAAG